MKGLNNLKITKYFLERFISEYCCNIKFDFYKEDFKYDKSFWLDIKHNPSAQPIVSIKYVPHYYQTIYY